MVTIIDTLIPAANITDNQSVAIALDGKDILICKANSEYYAVDNQCTHQRAKLTEGRIRNCFLSCPLHGVRFDLRTGKPMGELTKVPLKTYDISVSDDGNLHIDLD
ncbi:MAG: Rieske 2Fe-2S domain-containing protein [Porticoccaceae bacterium]|jgi:3-phenylpropionate/trans-cinnamate dioxygenase ferredoxin subunit|nr:Rieske 2Fe-2S domain-containing protein [Porticoccaceae bacterium]MBT3798199.1 Rieske 2Fe-2S domain-containing protein [Porticoccaceae bacterium]MBT4165301.1 Rieske 2Fe-2S domain-containing protein [Porticoccaceae bacterium]MBT4210474.1 Rieske 2Fe-2S domain-containing protein [Porticoccaceae bacterium]MBT4591602.1 Rieske 2Fe-2S domain-containing protein [Porticoccaceae bacterium]